MNDITNKDIMKEARGCIKEQVPKSFLAWLIVSISSVIMSIPVLGYILWGCVYEGYSAFLLSQARNQNISIKQLFGQFSKIKAVAVSYLAAMICVAFGFLFFIIPGIILFLNFSQIPFILIDNPEISGIDALKLSKKKMKGHRWEYVCLNLRFVGWDLLVGLTFGIAAIYVAPYYHSSLALFYERKIKH